MLTDATLDELMTEIDDDLYDHILCCNINEAVCGRNVTDVPFCSKDCGHHDTCPACEAILSDETWICPDCRRSW
jgi:hypothetical protein